MTVTHKTYRKHASVWKGAASKVDSLISKESPEQYFLSNANKFDTWEFLGKNRGKSASRGGLDLGKFYLSVCLEILSTASHWCEEAESYMKTMHKWQNRTGDAERGLFATIAGMEEDKIIMVLYHQVPYGVYLETRIFPKSGDLQILRPTLQVFSPKLTMSLQGLLERV